MEFTENKVYVISAHTKVFILGLVGNVSLIVQMPLEFILGLGSDCFFFFFNFINQFISDSEVEQS
jgi:hypothetical protein